MRQLNGYAQLGWTLLACLGLASTALGRIDSIDATVRSEVREFENGTEVNSDTAFEALGETSSTLPLDASTFLSRSAEEGNAGGAAAALFHDPRLSVTPDPNELTIGAAAFSRISSFSYTAKAVTDESRQVTLTSDELSFAAGTAVAVESRFFLDGVMVIWGDSEVTDLSSTQAALTLSVGQQGVSDASPVERLSATLTLSGASNGTANLTVTGALTADNVVVLNLTGIVQDLGPIHVVLIPSQEIPYNYEAVVDEQFELAARIEGTLRHQAGAGAAVFAGLTGEDLAGLLEEVLEPDQAEALANTITALLASGPLPLKPLKGDGLGDKITPLPGRGVLGLFPPLCGAAGVEVLPLLLGLGLMSAYCRRR